MEHPSLLPTLHDIHLHSCLYSDGWHDPEPLVAFASRYQHGPRWVGLTEHSSIRAEERQRARETREMLVELRPRLVEIAARTGVEVLLGVELDWSGARPSVPPEVLTEVDYALFACHGRPFDDPSQATEHLLALLRHPRCDVLAHPDRFLGSFDTRRCRWAEVFTRMAELGVLCEYNLATPLVPEVLALALDTPGLVFVVGSDLHDFRHPGVRRVMDAWGESLAGGFEASWDYLCSLLGDAPERMLARFDNPERLAALESRVYAAHRRYGPSPGALDEVDRSLLSALGAPPLGSADRAFLETRLARLSHLPPARLANTGTPAGFLTRCRRGRGQGAG
jgi:histidinol phosphatase-like PHP family hydrolase